MRGANRGTHSAAVQLAMPGYSEGARRAVLERLEALAQGLEGLRSIQVFLGPDAGGHRIEVFASGAGRVRLACHAHGESLMQSLDRSVARIEVALRRRRQRQKAKRRQAREQD